MILASVGYEKKTIDNASSPLKSDNALLKHHWWRWKKLKIEGDLRSPRGSFQLFLRDPNDEENKIIKSIKTSLQTEPRHFFKNFIVTDEGRFSEKKRLLT